MASKKEWLDKSIHFIEEDGNILNLADKLIIRNCVDDFFEHYLEVTGRKPIFDYSTLRVLYYSYILPFGYIMPHIERWEREDIFNLRNRLGKLKL